MVFAVRVGMCSIISVQKCKINFNPYMYLCAIMIDYRILPLRLVCRKVLRI